jgi:endoribonuclease Dicer
MEAILGASFLSGGISTALKAGRALGLSLWGAEICYMRSILPTDPELSESSSSPYFVKLEAGLGYKFSDSQILIEAVTHPSFSGDSSGKSYQRLEFLGDGKD